MKIAIISIYLPSGSKIGVGYQVHGLANSLAGRGHQVTVFSPCPTPIGAAYQVRIVRERKPLSSFRFGWDLRREDFGSFDVLNAHGDDWFLWGKTRPRHVHTYHGSMLAEMIHIKGVKEKLRMGALAICEQQSVFLPDETVAVSENTRRYVKGINHVIPCGVDTALFSPGGSRSDHPTILFVGTMHGRKRGQWLLDVFSKTVRSRVPNAELWCVCERPTRFTPPEGVTFFGRVDEPTLIELYRRAWVFCLPSSYEGFGVPYVEAMASGTPVVASPNLGAIEVTNNGRSGVLALDANLGEELVNLIGNSALREELIGRGLLRAQDFCWENICDSYEELYRGDVKPSGEGS